MLRMVLRVLHHARPDKWLTANAVASRCGVVAASYYEKDDRQLAARAVNEARFRVRLLLDELARINWLETTNGRAVSYRLLERDKRAVVDQVERRKVQLRAVAEVLGARSYYGGDTLYFDDGGVQWAHDLLRGASLLPGATDVVALNLPVTAAEALLACLGEGATPQLADVVLQLEAGVARLAAARLGDKACLACAGAGSIGHEDSAGFHRWTCDRCAGTGTEPAEPAKGTAASAQRARRGYLCSPECKGLLVAMTPHAWRVPVGWCEVQRCDVCAVLDSDAEAALMVAGDAARRVDMDSGRLRRIKVGDDARRAVCVVPIEAALARGLVVPGHSEPSAGGEDNGGL